MYIKLSTTNLWIHSNQIYVETLIHSITTLFFLHSNINIKVTGLGLLDWILSSIATWVVGIMNGQIIGLINGQLQQYISGILLLVDPAKYFG
jgi:hypothetical protein